MACPTSSRPLSSKRPFHHNRSPSSTFVQQGSTARASPVLEIRKMAPEKPPATTALRGTEPEGEPLVMVVDDYQVLAYQDPNGIRIWSLKRPKRVASGVVLVPDRGAERGDTLSDVSHNCGGPKRRAGDSVSALAARLATRLNRHNPPAALAGRSRLAVSEIAPSLEFAEAGFAPRITSSTLSSTCSSMRRIVAGSPFIPPRSFLSPARRSPQARPWGGGCLDISATSESVPPRQDFLGCNLQPDASLGEPQGGYDG
jgi:hypothetical protein